jgi:hypothetical protein
MDSSRICRWLYGEKLKRLLEKGGLGINGFLMFRTLAKILVIREEVKGYFL